MWSVVLLVLSHRQPSLSGTRALWMSRRDPRICHDVHGSSGWCVCFLWLSWLLWTRRVDTAATWVGSNARPRPIFLWVGRPEDSTPSRQRPLLGLVDSAFHGSSHRSSWSLLPCVARSLRDLRSPRMILAAYGLLQPVFQRSNVVVIPS